MEFVSIIIIIVYIFFILIFKTNGQSVIVFFSKPDPKNVYEFVRYLLLTYWLKMFLLTQIIPEKNIGRTQEFAQITKYLPERPSIV